MVVSFAGKLEADDASLNLVYNQFGEMYLSYAHKPALQKMVKDRWDFLITDCSQISYMLTPCFASDGFYIENDRYDIPNHVRNFTEVRHPGQGAKAEEELGLFVSAMSTLNATRKDSIFKMSAKVYWNCIGRHEFPTLFLCAKDINEMICSSAASERVWSVYRFIHSRLRAQLGNEKVEKLAFLYVNCAMLDQADKNDYFEAEGIILSGLDCLSDDEE